MNRRKFLIQSAGLAGAFLPASRLWAQAATACPPPTLSISTTSVATACGNVTPTYDYYISPTGSDANPGTMASPWAITAINTHSTLIAGKTVGLLSGSYSIGGLAEQSTGVRLQVPSGTAGAPTVIQSVTPQGAIITSKVGANGYQGTTPLIGNGIPNGASNTTPSYITLKNLTITGAQNSIVSFAGSTGSTCNGIVIDSCLIYDIQLASGGVDTGAVVFGKGVVNALINNCNIHDCYVNAASPTSYQTVSCILDDASGTTVQYCSLWNAHNLINQKALNTANHPAGMVIRYNYMYSGTLGSNTALNGFNSGTTTSSLDPTFIYNNIIENVALYNNNATGVSGLQADLYFYNNTYFVNGASPYTNGTMGPFVPITTATGVYFYNNIHQRLNLASGSGTNGHGDIEFGSLSGTLKVSNFNCYTSGDQVGVAASDTATPTVVSLATWQSENSSHDNASIAASPGFAGTITPGGGTSQYNLAGNSPCKNTGHITGIVTGQKTDMGAWGNGASQIGSTISS